LHNSARPSKNEILLILNKFPGGNIPGKAVELVDTHSVKEKYALTRASELCGLLMSVNSPVNTSYIRTLFLA